MNLIPTPLFAFAMQLESGDWLCLMESARTVIVYDPDGLSAYDRSPIPRSPFLRDALEAIR